MQLIAVTEQGLWCERARAHIDPWAPVERAVITHAHADHARPGCVSYLATPESAALLAHRMPEARVQALAYGDSLTLGDVAISLHPSGHVWGAAQVRLEHRGEVWVVSGDYKRAADPSCTAFAPVRCDTFITEATFALPIFRWPEPNVVVDEIVSWWQGNADRPSLLYCYSLGKAQRLLAELATRTDKPVYVHGAVEAITAIYREAHVPMLPTLAVAETRKGRSFAGELILAPLSAQNTPWARRFTHVSPAFASGFMRIRGERRRRALDRGFVLSDHADWPALLQTIAETGAQRVLATHGHSATLARHLQERGVDAGVLATHYEGELA